MEETQAIDFDDLPVQDEELVQVDVHQVVGELHTVSEPVDKIPLYLGLNVVGRKSSQADHEVMLNKWKADFPGMLVHGAFLQNNSISSTHAAIYLESAGAACWIKDLGSRNKTMLGRAGGLTVLQSKGDRYSVLQGDKLRFGSLETTISYGATFHQANTTGSVQAGSEKGNSRQATEAQRHVSRSPTPDMASAQAPSGPAAFTDNDMTLPWDDLPNDQQGLFPTGSAAQGSDAALNTASRVSEASPEPEKPAMETTVLPETQVNDLPNDLPVNIGSPELPSGPQDIAFAEPTQVVSAPTHLKGEPTQLIGEPTQLALPAHPVAVAPAALPGSHSGTALASAAAQAMTGAHPSQASALPASGGFPTAMPSLALPQAAAQSPAGSALAQNSGPDQVTSVSLPISRPQADAVLHLPSQPSGSQHAAHPHGAPRGVAHGGSRAAKLPDSQVSQLQQQFQPGEYSHQEQRQQHLAPPKTVQRAPAAAAGAESSDHNTLLDSVLGHDDDDSIWMPPAFLPDSEGPTAAAQPASLPAGGGRTMPPDLHVPTAGALEGSAPAAPAVPKPVQQASDSDQTQDSDRQPGAQQDSHEDAAGPTSALPPAKDRPTKQGNASRALPHAEEGMYTGAFAFPDSASLEVSQPALDLPHKSGRARRTTAAKAAAEGKTIKAAAAAAVGEAEKEAAPAVMHARAAKDASGASTSSSTGAATTGGSTKGRVMPSGWKRKKADPVADGTGSTSPEAAADAAPAPTGPAAAPAGPPTAAPAGLSAAAPAGALGDLAPHAAAPREQAAPGSIHFAHGAGKPSPWRVRGAPLGVGPGPSQAPDSEDISAAMAAAGNLAAFFPSTQAEPEADASTAAVNTAGAPSGSTATAGPTADKSNPTGAGSDDDAAQAVPTHAAPAPQPSASKAAGQTHGATAASDSGPPSAEAGAAEQQEAVAAAAASKSADMLSHAQPDDAEGVQTGRAAAPRQTSRRKQSGRAAVVDDEGEQGDQASGRGRGRARGKGSGARGGSGGRSRGRKRSSADMAAADEEARGEEPQRSATEVAASKGKRGGPTGREASPAPQPTRASKRQKAKAEAQAADAAQEEEGQDPDEDPFSGAATQAAAGALEELRRSATPDADAAPHEAPPPPAPLPTLKGKRSRTKRPAPATSAADSEAAAAAAEAFTTAPVGAVDQSVDRPSKKTASSQPRASAQSKATGASGRKSSSPPQDSAAHSAVASASTAAGSRDLGSTAAGTGQEGEEGSEQVKQAQTGAGSRAQARRKSRLSKASSPTPELSPVPDAAAEAPVKQRVPARRGSAKQPSAEHGQRGDDSGGAVPKRRSGTSSTAVKAGGTGSSQAAAAGAGKQAAGSDSTHHTADEDISTSKASSTRGRATRKSAQALVDDEHPLAVGGVQPASTAEATAAADMPSADVSADTAMASKAKKGSRVTGTAVGSHSQAAAAAEETKPSAASTRKRRGSQGKGISASQSNAAAAEDDGEEEAGPSLQPGGSQHAVGKGVQARASRGKCSRQSIEDAADSGPAGDVKAARKATDSKPVRVLYSTSLDKSKKSSMSKIIRRLGGSVEDGEGPDFTHFVALQPTAANQTDRGFKKSINALIALAAGRPIVSETWVEACGRSSSFVDPLDHLLLDKAAQKKFGFDLRTSYERAQHQLLLAGLHVFFTPGALAGESDGGTNIQNLVEHAGGVLEAQLPKSLSSKDPEMLSQWLLVGSEHAKDKELRLCRKQYAAGLAFHGRSFLIDSIMQQCLDRKHGILFTT